MSSACQSVIVAASWGFVSHAELVPDVAAANARHAVQCGWAVLAALNTERSDWRPTRIHRRRVGLELPDVIRAWAFPRPPEKIAVLRDYLAVTGADGIDHASASLNAVKERPSTPTPRHRLPNSGCGCCRA